MLFRLISIFCLPLLFLNGDLQKDPKFSVGNFPDWVKPCEFLTDSPPLCSQENLQRLLIDVQQNWEAETFYHHTANKALSPSGVSALACITINFDPSYEEVVVHAIRLFRNQKVYDRLENARCQVVQREENLESNLYDGVLSVIYFLNDVREGDIVEYAYSIIGTNPVFPAHCVGTMYFQKNVPVDKISCRLLVPADQDLVIKPMNTLAEPVVTDLSDSLKEWSWVVTNTPETSYEVGVPIWHNSEPHVQFSAYKDWDGITKNILPLLALQDDYYHSVSPDIVTLVNSWKMLTEDPKERALLALRFVQDEIRYLGMEEGIWGFTPKDPNETFETRFGDCKNKAFLLQFLLSLMDIPSCPVLVHSALGKTLQTSLPTQYAFNHAILQIEIDGIRYWVDPTITLQGGSLSHNFTPNYHHGLLISESFFGLAEAPKEAIDFPIEIEQSYTLISKNQARLKMKRIYQGAFADNMRYRLKNHGANNLAKDLLLRLKNCYANVAVEEPLSIVDDRENNVITFTHSHILQMQRHGDQVILDVFPRISLYLNGKVSPDRTSPYAIDYPNWVREHIHIENPYAEDESNSDEYAFSHESVLYNFSMQQEGGATDYFIELKHLQDHIPADGLQSYWDILDSIERESALGIVISD